MMMNYGHIYHLLLKNGIHESRWFLPNVFGKKLQTFAATSLKIDIPKVSFIQRNIS